MTVISTRDIPGRHCSTPCLDEDSSLVYVGRLTGVKAGIFDNRSFLMAHNNRVDGMEPAYGTQKTLRVVTS